MSPVNQKEVYMPFGKWATVREAADYYDLTRQRIHVLVKRGAFGNCRKFNGPGGMMWLIPYPFVRVQIGPGPGRPRKTREDGIREGNPADARSS